MQKYYPDGLNTTPNNWFAAFEQLELLVKKNKNQKKIIFPDEIPWLDTAQSGFIPALDYFWNSFASARKDIVLVVCGSAASWMINTLIHNKGGLHNRVPHRIRLERFSLSECEEFFKLLSGVFSRYQIIQLYMVMGGIPFYLDHVDVGMSAAQNINRLCFQPDGLLAEEGFIRRYLSFGKSEKGSLYQLIDFYSLFYIKFIRGNHAVKENDWIKGLYTPQQRAWSGYAFEQVCLAHLMQIKHALGISGIQTSSSSWINMGKGNKRQIDLVIDRKDDVINLCEMKFSIKPFTIDKNYHEELQDKIETFRTATQTTKSLFLTMITTFGIARNECSNNVVQNSLKMEDLFG